MNKLPPLLSKPRSVTLSTRMPKLTLARIGLSAGSNASSVMLKSVSRTGTIRLLLQMNSGSADIIGRISSMPACAIELFDRSWLLAGYTMVSSAASCG